MKSIINEFKIFFNYFIFYTGPMDDSSLINEYLIYLVEMPSGRRKQFLSLWTGPETDPPSPISPN